MWEWRIELWSGLEANLLVASAAAIHATKAHAPAEGKKKKKLSILDADGKLSSASR